MCKIAIIGAGISGLSAGQILGKKHTVELFDKASKPGGLVKCDRINDNLFHKVGGHVFNSRNQKVLDWFWNFFDRDTEFIKARRNANSSMRPSAPGGFALPSIRARKAVSLDMPTRWTMGKFIA